ncbi:MAG: hypothetical protein KGL93_12535 [Gemmatimonadota bacterium]|nr:hypothetical protein [Gemmatimonadota bacterium]HEU4989104.1 hypothetical protein [Gemmatimonadaceae bacterium]
MGTTKGLLLVVIAGAAFFGSRIAFGWLGRRWIVVSGAEYLLLGVILGPHAAGLLSRETLDSFAPFTSLAIGWIGAQIGARLILPTLVRIPARLYRVAIVESLLTVATVTAIMTVALAWWLPLPWEMALTPALALGGIATVASEGSVRVAAESAPDRGPVLEQLEVSAAASSVIAIAVISFILAVHHVAPAGPGRPPTTTEWAVINAGIGIVGGALFHLFLGDDVTADRLFISMAGALILVSGAAEFIRVSPLLATLWFGAVLANTTRHPTRIVASLDRVQRPLYFALLIFGGANWHPSVHAWALPVALFLIVRIGARVGSGRLSARWNGELPALGEQWSWGLVGQGGLAVAIALSYVFQDNLPLPNIVLTAAILSVLLTEVLSARLIQALLRFRFAAAIRRAPAPNHEAR